MIINVDMIVYIDATSNVIKLADGTVMDLLLDTMNRLLQFLHGSDRW